ncbi:MAG: Hsp20/alpha crystallin family protein [Bacteroidota bacterium]
MKFHPDIQTYREDRRRSMLTSPARRSFFMGRSFFDLVHEEETAPVNVKKTEEGFTLEIGLPGFNRDQIEVSVADDVLTIRANKKDENAQEGEYLVRELHTESLVRQLSLPPGLGKEDIQAKYENGLLRLNITDVPEEQEKASKTIPVE